MYVLVLAGMGFGVGAVAGWLATMGFYLAYLAVTGANDHDGGGAMAYGLVIGPVVGIVAGVALATVVALWATGGRRSRGK
jgi:hypothetical protein